MIRTKRSNDPRRIGRTAPRTGVAAMVAAALLLATGVPVQGHVSDSDLDAVLVSQFAMVADPLWGVEAGSRGVLYERAADATTGVASIGKAWLTHVALHALEAGWVTEDEAMAVTADSLNQVCNCFTDVNNQRIVAGEQFRFGDALRAQHLRSSNDLAQSVAEHLGLRLAQADGGTCGFGPFPSGCLQEYLDAANLHAQGVGVSPATVFTRPEALDTTTMRDVLLMWTHALDEHPEYVDWAAPGNINIQSLPPLSRTFPAQATEAILGLEARKGGNNAACNLRLPGMNCYVSSAERIGRRLVEVQGAGSRVPDAVALYDHGFAKTFHPEEAGLSVPLAPVQDHALACVSGGKAVSATLKPNGVTRLVLWNVDMDVPSIEAATQSNPLLPPTQLGFGTVEPLVPAIGIPAFLKSRPIRAPPAASGPVLDVLAGAPDPVAPPLPVRNPLPLPPGPPLGLPGLDLGPVQQVAIAPLGSTAFVHAQRGATAVHLGTWGIDGDQLVPLGTTMVLAPSVQDMKLVALTDNRFLLVLHEQDGDRRFQSWVAHGDGSMDLAHGFGAAKVEEFDLAVQEHFGAPMVFVGARDFGGDGRAEAWTMAPDGTLHFAGSASLATGAFGLAVSAAPVEAVDGEFIVDPHFAMAYLDDDRFGRIAYWNHDGIGLVQSGMAVVSGGALPAATTFALEPLGSSGLMMAKHNGEFRLDLDVFESRRDTPTVQPLFVVGHPAQLVDEFRGFCKVPRPVAGAPSEGDYLLAADEFFEDGLQLSGWRSAERPH